MSGDLPPVGIGAILTDVADVVGICQYGLDVVCSSR